MLDARVVRASPDAVKEATRVKGIASPELVDAWLVADETRRRAQTGAEALRAEQRKLSDRIGALKRQLGGGAGPELEALMARGDELKQEQQALADAQAAAEAEAEQIMLQLPAIPDPTWPVGADAGDNRVVRTWADPSCAPAPLAASQKDHIALGRSLGILDFERGVKLAGSRSYVIRGAATNLYWA